MQALEKIDRSISEQDDLHLIAFRKGDSDVFRDTYEKLSKGLLYYVQNIIDSPDDAEDVVANAFMKLFKSRQHMESFDHIRRWLYVIARHEAIDHLRIKSRSREIHQEYGQQGDTDEEMADLEILKMGLLQNLFDAINGLPKQRKTIVQLYFFEKKTTAEIAAQMNLNSQTVLNHKARALEALRKTVLAPEGLIPGLLTLLPGFAFFLLK